jgi:hypothetical protein
VELDKRHSRFNLGIANVQHVGRNGGKSLCPNEIGIGIERRPVFERQRPDAAVLSDENELLIWHGIVFGFADSCSPQEAIFRILNGFLMSVEIQKVNYLSIAREREIENHLLTCAHCRARLSTGDEGVRFGFGTEMPVGLPGRSQKIATVFPFRTHLPFYSLEAGRESSARSRR